MASIIEYCGHISIFQSESEPEIDIYFQRGMSLKTDLASNTR